MSSPFPFHVKEHVVEAQHIREYPRATLNSQDETLYLSVKQYIPKDNPDPQPGDVTIIGAHANGFPKEMYEALWEDLWKKSASSGFRIRGIWIADVAWQGASGVLNEDKLGNDPSWLDHARDLLHLINIFRDSMPRPLVGIGHSFGGSILVALSLLHPRLLTSLVLLDSVVSRFASNASSTFDTGPIAMSAFRRDVWPGGREEAREAFAKNTKYYGAWDPRVFEAWLRFGLREMPTRLYPDKDADGTAEKGSASAVAVTLTTTKHQECFTFLRPSWPGYDSTGTVIVDRTKVPDLDPALAAANFPTYPFYRPEPPALLAQLPHVRPGVLWVNGLRSQVSPEWLRRERTATTGVGAGGSGGIAAGRVKEVSLDVGHLIPMERPTECADLAAQWIRDDALVQWRREEDELSRWRAKSTEEKERLTDDCLRWLRRRREVEKAKM